MSIPLLSLFSKGKVVVVLYQTSQKDFIFSYKFLIMVFIHEAISCIAMHPPLLCSYKSDDVCIKTFHHINNSLFIFMKL